jgi:hypothetical protein
VVFDGRGEKLSLWAGKRDAAQDVCESVGGKERTPKKTRPWQIFMFERARAHGTWHQQRRAVRAVRAVDAVLSTLSVSDWLAFPHVRPRPPDVAAPAFSLASLASGEKKWSNPKRLISSPPSYAGRGRGRKKFEAVLVSPGPAMSRRRRGTTVEPHTHGVERASERVFFLGVALVRFQAPSSHPRPGPSHKLSLSL